MDITMKKMPKKKNIDFKRSFKSLSLAQKSLLFVFLAILASTFLPALIVLLIGLLPTITILIVDPKNSAKLVIVGCFNLSGLFVYLINLINKFSFDSAFSLLSDVFNMIIMLGSAALGFLVYHEMPNLFAYIAQNSAQRRLVNIDKELEKITEEWGEKIIDEQIHQPFAKKP